MSASTSPTRRRTSPPASASSPGSPIDIKRMRLGTGTVNLPNAHPASGRRAGRDARPHARRPVQFRHQPGRPACRTPKCSETSTPTATRCSVEAIDLVLRIWTGEPPYALEGKYWKISTARTMMADIGQGMIARPLQKPHPPIVVTAVSPHSQGVTEAAARGWDVDLGEFPAAEMGRDPLAEIPRGLRAGGPAGRSGRLARRQIDLRRRRPRAGQGLRARATKSRIASTTASSSQSC